MLQTRLVERWGVGVGIGASSVIFGLWHFDLRQGVMAIAMGLWLGWCAHRQKSIINIAFAHALNNGFAFALTRLTPSRETDFHGTVIAIYVVAGAFCFAAMSRRTRGLAPD